MNLVFNLDPDSKEQNNYEKHSYQPFIHKG